MSDEHDHHHGHHHDHGHRAPEPAPAPEARDAGSQALAEALRSSFAIVKIVLLLLVVAFFASGFFQVGPAEKAIILRFGKPVGEGTKALLTPGLHWSLPYPIDEVVKIPVTESQKVVSSSGWYFTTPAQEASGEELPASASLNPAIDGYAITSDRNIIHVRVTLYYHIANPIDYVFNFEDASNLVQNVLNNALLYTSAHFKVDDVIYNDIAGFQADVQQRVTELAESEKLSIVIDQCSVDRIPPRQLQDIFDQVATARENSSRIVTDARNYATTNLLAAAARATAITNQAEADRKIYVSSMNALAQAFTVELPEYQRNPVLFRQQQLGNLLASGSLNLTNAQRVEFLQRRPDGKPREMRILLNDLPPQPKLTPSE